MKKLFTLLCLSVLTFGATAAMAEGYQGSAPAAGTFYIYNVETGQWLGDNFTNSSYYTTHAMMSARGLDFDLIDLGDGTYQIDPKFNGNRSLNANTYSGYDCYMDGAQAVTHWTFALADGADDVYTITGLNDANNNVPLGLDANGVPSTLAPVSAYEWKLVTRENRIAYEYSIASSTNPVDMSWLVLGGECANSDLRRTDTTIWQGEHGSEGSHIGKGIWDYVWEIYWINADRDIYQEIEDIPNGKYVVNAHAMYSPTSDTSMSYTDYLNHINGDDPTRGYIYANDQQSVMPNAYDYATTELVSGYNERVPNDTPEEVSLYVPGATAQFAAYMYDGKATVDDMNVDVTDNKLTVGIKVEHQNYEFVVVDAFCVYYYGDGSNDVVAEPTPYTGSEPAEGTFYLYNVETGQWLGDNFTNTDYYTTHAMMSARGLDFDLIDLEDGTYQIDPKFSGNRSLNAHTNSGYDCYMDGAQAVTHWTFALVNGTEDVYTITGLNDAGDNVPLGLDANGVPSTLAPESAYEWKLVTRENRMDYEYSIASSTNPVDMSWLVLGGEFASNDLRRTDTDLWQGERGNNGSHIGKGKWDYVWEVFYIDADRDIYQEIEGIPNGKYVVNAHAMYSPTSDTSMSYTDYLNHINGDDPTRGYIYANDQQSVMPNAYDYATTGFISGYNEREPLNSPGGLYVPGATAQFAAYMYDGQATVDDMNVDVTDNKLTVGIKVEHQNYEFVVVDAFCVYYYGDGSNDPEPTPYTGSEPAEGIYYLYNVGTGTWLGENDYHEGYWTTRAELSERGLDFTLTALEDGAYKIAPGFGGLGFLPARTEDGYDLYMDYYSPTMDPTPWTFTLVAGTDDTYTITGVDQNGDLAPLGTNANGYASSREAVDNLEWKLVSRENRIAYETSIASDDNPVDMSWLIPNGTLANNDERADYWMYSGRTNSSYVANEWWYYIWECWNLTNFDYYQNIVSVPNGKYLFNGDAIYTSTGDGGMGQDRYEAYLDGTDPTLGYVYVNDATTPMVNAYSLSSTENNSTYSGIEIDGLYFPKNTAQRAAYLKDGKGHTDDGEVTVTDGMLRAGFKVVDNPYGTAWVVFHRINLFYCGGDGTTTEVADITPGDYYLYNVGTGTYLGENNTNPDWYTTRAELSTRGRAFGITKSSNGGYKIDPYMGGNHTLNAGNINPNDPEDGDLYMDTSFPVTNWIITNADNEGEYYLTSFGYKLGATADGLATTDADAAAYDTWKLVTREERIANEKAVATADNPVDMSWLILGGTFPRNDDYTDCFTVTNDSYRSIHGDGYYNCNAVWELYGITTEDVYQQINDIPNGIYKLNANAVYVSTDGSDCSADHFDAYYNGTEPTLGYIYANNDDVPMRNIYELDLLTEEYVADHNTKDLGNGYWAYNGYTEFSTNYFEGKGYTDYVETTVTDGTLTVGARVDGAGELTRQWILLDNFSLYYYGSADADIYERICEEIDGLRTALDEAWATVEANAAEYGNDIPEDLIEKKEAIEEDIANLQAEVDEYYANDELAAQENAVEADITEIQGEIDSLINDIATGINSVEPTETTTTGVYTITGQKVSAPTTKGIYIINGKKVLVK